MPLPEDEGGTAERLGHEARKGKTTWVTLPRLEG